ncbi:Mini-ribonuclease 3 [Paenibacillus validus]|uniref:Mini-ribonuclease 3 n=1 Tax=Paenibacillus validus TaxID=44253 RepID=A0A7X2ZER3_9BACL|nr:MULTISPECIES: Mini-ribonuclease 3 [Paenibacillus]MED4600381.1 Mini-ribonuclease 3 [Paenibacillus validus]MED4606042.1 Mini-ribonuclease 3 [Paenibacillus validus]MUG73532.1 ribonuclease III [Paenibacillus validus]
MTGNGRDELKPEVGSESRSNTESKRDPGPEPDPFGVNLFAFPPAREPRLLNPLVLAYMGDAVYEVFIRQYVVSQTNHKPNHLHRLATRYVSAKAQAKSLTRWLPLLTEEETDIVKRGRNAKSATKAKNADVLEYRHSTAFECLIGYLYYMRRWERLLFLLNLSLEREEEAELKKSKL